ncbi:MAG: ORF6N domain-containing protein [Spirochaetes bacterium]|nr:ORF6N domain-containing protein [Spirochaetota bacterium]
MLTEGMILKKIYNIHGHSVMPDRDLAELYGAETRTLNQAVKWNNSRFPDDFMFQLTREAFSLLRSQIALSSWRGTRKPPVAFTEQGIARHRDKGNHRGRETRRDSAQDSLSFFSAPLCLCG